MTPDLLFFLGLFGGFVVGGILGFGAGIATRRDRDAAADAEERGRQQALDFQAWQRGYHSVLPDALVLPEHAVGNGPEA